MVAIIRKVSLNYLLLSLLFFSCSDFTVEHTNLYAINGLIDQQSRYLTENGARLTKISNLRNAGDTIVVVPKSSDEWKKELEIFSMIDVINKPANRNLYTIEEFPDNKSNLIVKAFTTKEDLPVSFLKCYYLETESKVRRIEAKYDESNTLYKSTRTLKMEFQPVDDTFVLTSYEIYGDQKMFLSDSVKYSIRGIIALPN